MGIFQNNLMGAAAAAASAGSDFYDHQIANSCRFTGSGAMNDSRSGDGSTTKGTLSFWFKRSTLSDGSNDTFLFYAREDGNNQFRVLLKEDDTIELMAEVGASIKIELETTQVFRDTSAWYHFCAIIDMTDGTAGDRAKMYINGERVTAFDVETYPSDASQTMVMNTAATAYVGENISSGNRFNGYLAEYVVIDGTDQAITDMGESKNGVWIPKDPSGLTFGTNGFYLKYESSSDLGNDSSGNNHDFTVSGLSAHDQMLDTPTFNSSSNGGNFSTFNAVYRGDQSDDQHYGALTEGNLKMSFVSNGDCYRPATIKTPASGKWYFEYLINAGGGSSGYSPAMGIINPDVYTYANRGSDGSVGSIVYGNHQNKVYKDESVTGTYGGSRGSNGDVMGIAVDMDNGAFYVSKNGTFQTISGGSQGDPTSGASRTGAGATWTPASDYKSGMVALGAPTGGSVPIITANFGQEGTFAGEKTAGGNSDTNGYGNFFSAVPSGYSAICSGALSVADAIDPAQTDDNFPQKLFNPLLYVGNSTDDRNVTGVGFAPDWVWIKDRDVSEGHQIYDSNRGAEKRLQSNYYGAEDTTSDVFQAFQSDGFQLGSHNDTNKNGSNFVAWNWRANGGTTSTNSNGSISVTQQVDPSGGFSISTYSGTDGTPTIGHGLSSAPTFVVVKQRNGNNNWAVYAKGAGATKYGFLEGTAGWGTDNMWGNTTPSSTLVYLGVYSQTHGSGNNYVAYCFADTEGYIKSGAYVGNGEGSNGTFVYTGFRPAFILVKRVTGGATAGSWFIQDNTRDIYNPVYHVLKANSSNAEEAYTDGTDYNDFLSNGFKVARGGDAANFNADGETYMYLAMAHNPFKYATAR